MPKGEGLYPAPTNKRINDLDARISDIQNGTRALIPAVVPLHDILRQKFQWYYRWTAWPISKTINILVLLIYILGTSWFAFNSFATSKANIDFAAGTKEKNVDYSAIYKSVKPDATEVLSKRTENTKVFQNKDGTQQYIISGGPLHYKDANNNFKNIDSSIIAKEDGTGFAMDRSIYTADFNKEFISNPLVQIEKDSQALSVKPGELSYSNTTDNQKISDPLTSSGESNGHQVLYKNAYGPGLDFSYETQDLQLNKKLNISTLESLPTPTIDMTSVTDANLKLNLEFGINSGLELFIDNDPWDGTQTTIENKSIIFKKDGKTLWQLTAPKAWDSSPVIASPEGAKQSIIGKAQISLTGEKLNMSVLFPYSWLKTATYPVTIDPDTYYGAATDGFIKGDTSGIGADYNLAHSTATGYESGAFISVGQEFIDFSFMFPGHLIYNVNRGYLEFDTSGIDDSSSVSQANLYLTVPDGLDWSYADFTVQIHEFNWTSPLAGGNIEASYDGALAATTNAVDWKNTSDVLPDTTYASNNLRNAWVSKTGYTQYALLSDRDVEAIEPTDAEKIFFYYQESDPQAYRPYLSIITSNNSCQSSGTGNWNDPSKWTSCNGDFPEAGDSVTILDTHTITLTADTSITTGSITINSGGQLNTGDNNLTVNNITNNGTLVAGYSYTIYVAGNWTNNNVFTPNESFTAFNGSGDQTISGSATHDFWAINVFKTGGKLILGVAVTISGSGGIFNLYMVNSTINLQSYDLTLSGATDGMYSSASSAPYTFIEGTGKTIILADNVFVSESVAGVYNFGNIQIGDGSHGPSISTNNLGGGSTYKFGTFNIAAGTFAQGYGDVIATGNFTIAATGATFTKGIGAVKLKLLGDLTFTGPSTPQNLGAVEIGASPDTTDLASDWASDSLTINSGDIFNTNGYEVDIGTGGISLTGTLTTTDDVETDGTIITDAGNFTVNSGGTFTAGTNTNVAGNWTNDGIFVCGIGDVNFNGGGDQTISGSGSQTFWTMGVNKTGGQLILGTNVTISAEGALFAMSIVDSTMNLQTYDLTFSANSDALFNAASSSPFTFFTSTTGKIVFLGATGITSESATGTYNFGNIQIGDETHNPSLVLVDGGMGGSTFGFGSVTIANSSAVFNPGDLPITVSGNWSNIGSFIKGAGGVTFNGTTSTTYLDTNYNVDRNLGPVTIAKTSGTSANNKVTLATATYNTMKVDTLTISADNTLDMSANDYQLEIANNGVTDTVFSNSGTFVPGISTVRYSARNSGGNVNLATVPYSSLKVWANETYDLTGSLEGANDITGDLEINGGAILTTGSNYNIEIKGNWTTNHLSGKFTSGTGTVNFTGTGAQTLYSGGITDDFDFYNFTHSGAGTLQLLSYGLDINGNFTNSAGIFDANNLNINIAKDFDISGGSFNPKVGGGATTQAVIFDSVNQANISGSTIFNNLTMDSTTDGAKTIKFPTGSANKQVVTGTWTLDGDTGKVLTLRSISEDTPWEFAIPADFTAGDYIDVKDSQNMTNAYRITPGANTVSGGNNAPGWNFVPEVPTIGVPVAISATAIEWHFTDTSANETGFKIYDSGDNLVATCATADLAYCTETGLNVNTQYTGRYVVAYNSVGNSAPSGMASSIYTFANTPLVPTVLANYNEIDGYFADLILNANENPDGTEYKINTNDWQAQNDGATQKQTGLDCNQNYTYSIIARNGDLVETAEIEGNDITPLCAPNNLLETNLLSDSVTLGWSAVEGTNPVYDINLGNDKSATNLGTTSNISNLSLNQGSLDSETDYYYKVRAHNDNGTGAWSTVKKFTTIASVPPPPLENSPLENSPIAPEPEIITSGAVTTDEPEISCDQKPSTPSNLRATDIGLTTLSLAWDPSVAPCELKTYDVFNADTGIKVGSVTTRILVLTDLGPDTSYNFFVVAIDNVGNTSEPSETLTIKTLKSAEKLEVSVSTCRMGGGQVAYLILGNTPAEIISGQTFPKSEAVKVMVSDGGGELCDNYLGSVYFTSTDSRAELTWNADHPYNFTDSDNGIHEFDSSDFRLYTEGNQILTITDKQVLGQAEIKVLAGNVIFQKAQDTVTNFFDNNSMKVNNAVVTTTTVLLLAPALVNVAVGFGNFLPQIIYWLTQLLQLVGMRRKRKPWGVVFNSQTGQPVSLAQVRIFDKEYHRLLESVITDKKGRFGILVRPGTFYLVVSRSGFKFPSQFKVSEFFENAYTGGNINIDSKTDKTITLNIPLDPVVKASVVFSFLIMIVKFNRFLQKIRVPMMVIGVIFSLVMIVTAYHYLYVLSLILYVFFFILEIFSSKKTRPYGIVSDIFGNPLETAIVRIFNKRTNRLIATDVTDAQGRFKFFVDPGIYYLMTVKPGYMDFKSHIMYLEGVRTMVTTNIKLKKIKKQSPN